MYRARLDDRPKSAEKDFAFEFERAHYITLGLVYERSRAFRRRLRATAEPGGQLHRQAAQGRARRSRGARGAGRARRRSPVALVAAGKKRGLMHPYLKKFHHRAIKPAHPRAKKFADVQGGAEQHDQGARGIRFGTIHFGQIRAAAQIAPQLQSRIPAKASDLWSLLRFRFHEPGRNVE